MDRSHSHVWLSLKPGSHSRESSSWRDSHCRPVLLSICCSCPCMGRSNLYSAVKIIKFIKNCLLSESCLLSPSSCQFYDKISIKLFSFWGNEQVVFIQILLQHLDIIRATEHSFYLTQIIRAVELYYIKAIQNVGSIRRRKSFLLSSNK